MLPSVCLLSHCFRHPRPSSRLRPKLLLPLPCQPPSLPGTLNNPLSFPPSFSVFLSPLWCCVAAPDAACLGSVGRISVMGPSRNSKHHSGIFFQAIAFFFFFFFCSNKGGVALASPSLNKLTGRRQNKHRCTSVNPQEVDSHRQTVQILTQLRRLTLFTFGTSVLITTSIVNL